MELTLKGKVRSLIIAFIVVFLGLIFFKYIPMGIFGREILFDASMHLTIVIFVLYVSWYFVDQNNSWRIPYLVFAFIAIGVVSVQRIYANAHNDIGLLFGFLISALGIVISRWDYFKDKFRF